MICICESEVILFQLYLYVRRAYPGTPLDQKVLREVLERAAITTMRQLFDVDSAHRRELALDVVRRLSGEVDRQAQALAA
jgi:hypothetical protein